MCSRNSPSILVEGFFFHFLTIPYCYYSNPLVEIGRFARRMTLAHSLFVQNVENTTDKYPLKLTLKGSGNNEAVCVFHDRT